MKSTRLFRWALALVLGAAMSLSARAELKATTLANPVPVKPPLIGPLKNVKAPPPRYAAAVLVIKPAKGDRELKWPGLPRLSQFAVRKLIVDPNSADEWI